MVYRSGLLAVHTCAPRGIYPRITRRQARKPAGLSITIRRNVGATVGSVSIPMLDATPIARAPGGIIIRLGDRSPLSTKDFGTPSPLAQLILFAAFADRYFYHTFAPSGVINKVAKFLAAFPTLSGWAPPLQSAGKVDSMVLVCLLFTQALHME